MDWGIIGTVLAIVFFTTTVIVTLRLAKRKKPVWAYKATKIIGLGTDAPRELKLTFNGTPVNDVYQTTFILFNKGKEAIRQGDVTEKVTIRFRGGEILREPTIKVRSTEAIKFSAKREVKERENSIELDFLYLDHEDGAIFEVLHTESREITCISNIIGTKKITNIGEFESSQPRPTIIRPIIISVLSVISVLLITMGATLGLKIDAELLGPIYIFLGVFCVMLISDIRSHIRYNKFPNWSRNIPTEEAFLIEEGASIKAYCVKCRAKVTMMNPHIITMKNGRPAIQGVCPNCGTKVFRIPPS